MLRRSDKGVSAAMATLEFEKELQHQEDLLYGVALYFECLSLVHADQAAIVETHRKQFRNIIQKSRDRLEQARALLAEVEKDPSKAAQLGSFTFMPGEGHPNPEELAHRATILVETYNEIFSGRNREQDFTPAELFRLIEEASQALK